jgi:hypothetical protein
MLQHQPVLYGLLQLRVAALVVFDCAALALHAASN